METTCLYVPLISLTPLVRKTVSPETNRKENSKIKSEVRFLPRQAKPAAEEAKPAAVGKLLYESIYTCNFSQSFFAILIFFSLSSTSLARLRISLKQFWYLAPERDISYTNQKRNPIMNQQKNYRNKVVKVYCITFPTI